jgi:hypothetical protein
MEDIELDREGNVAVISALGKTPYAARIEFQWPVGTTLTDQSDKTLQIISELLKA